MSDYIIKVENLGKSYQIKHQNSERYTALRDVITNGVKNFGGRLLGRHNGHDPTRETFWALKDVSFEVQPGERVGIIGRNGAGKSTLLKVLSRITEPAAGRVRLRGRVASLLEVGTGFHPELTGRENIFLNGAILGMTRDEIKRKFDEIVAFAEVEKFLDTPVKRYSSGMYVRLAFAVAAHLEPEILVVDEVLAVGDAQFQKKCLGKMEDVAGEGRTVLFVSHNMAAIHKLCRRAILLEEGSIHYVGNTDNAIAMYSAQITRQIDNHWARDDDTSTSAMFFSNIVLNLCGEQPTLRLECQIIVQCIIPCAKAFIAVDICDGGLSPIMQALPEPEPFIDGIIGKHELTLEIQLPPLIPGIYTVDFWIGSHHSSTYDYIKQVGSFEVVNSPTRGRSYPHTHGHGFVVPTSRYHYRASTIVID